MTRTGSYEDEDEEAGFAVGAVPRLWWCGVDPEGAT